MCVLVVIVGLFVCVVCVVLMCVMGVCGVECDVWLICGFGNLGVKFVGMRYNVGFEVVDVFV